MNIKCWVLSLALSLGFFAQTNEAHAQSMRTIRLPAAQVLGALSPYLESEFDTIIIANTASDGSSKDFVPFQHARVITKKSSNKPLFQRNSAGEIVAFNENNITNLEGLPLYVPISSGLAADGGIKTFSGIFRINLAKSISGLSTSKEAPMSYAVYIDAHYGSKVSGVAIHGTPTKNHDLLGVSRASHGCLRTYPKYAKIIYEFLIKNPDNTSKQLPMFDRYKNLPDEVVQLGGLGDEEGVKALFIIFNGYDTKTSLQ